MASDELREQMLEVRAKRPGILSVAPGSGRRNCGEGALLKECGEAFGHG